MAHFSDCGKHCEHAYCRQQDMLPFQCDACGKTYCSEHFSYDDHSCPKGRKDRDRRVIVCPLCTAAVPLPYGEDENLVWERHATNGLCQPKEVEKKPNRCPAKGCKEKLTLTNSCNCGTCGIKVCLKHRYEDQHECKPAVRKGRPGDSCRTAAGKAAEARAIANRGAQFLASAGDHLRRLVK
eukprot:gb/GFBE01038844.1/.p1 GENE.gb/GFBE01038844.1/~~gb/GFBE01038844.1/.p1  ORF type:complete len:182 (+),score=34.33 gb/GFBE01038844.1/:1-546(+)